MVCITVYYICKRQGDRARRSFAHFALAQTTQPPNSYRLQAGERLASMAIRRWRRQRQRELGSAPAVLYVAGSYGVFSLEELLDVLSAAPRESLLPALAKPSSPDSPT